MINSVEGILAKLISFPCLGGDSNLPIILWIDEYIRKLGVETQLVYNNDKNKAGLHCRIGPAVNDGIILSGHTDVVPTEGQPWDTDPFVLTDKNDGKLYARGSCDMKGFVACCLAALPEMIAAKLERPIYFAFSYDEEIGCLGAPYLIEAFQNFYKEKPAYAIIGEPSLMQPMIGQKGIYVVDTYVNGSAGHSSRIKDEVSAIHEGTRLILWLESKMNALIENGHIDDRFYPPHSTLHVGVAKGGIAFNVIADQFHFQWDMRTIPRDKAYDIMKEFESYCRERETILRTKFKDFEIKNVELHPPVVALDTAPDMPIVDLVKKLSGVMEWDTVSYAAEAGQFSEAGYQSIICGPGSIAQAHRANEFIAKSELVKGMEFMRKLIKELSL